MGGASEDDNAMRWFLERADGGDILVFRTSGSDGYNSYLFSDLGVTVNSVETIVCHNSSASSDPYVLQRIQQAEAVFFAGGDQWDYISFWRNTPFNAALNTAITQRSIVIGGTSAGMAIQGQYYFSAQNGTVTSAAALNNPFSNLVTVDSAPFLANAALTGTITDSHFDNPDRKGRMTTFLARILTDNGVQAKGIACDEYTAVCIDELGSARVFGGYPDYDDNAYFIQTNCELEIFAPENCTSNNPLNWNLGGEALKVYRIKGNDSGTNSFDLNSWQSGSGGTWLNWSVNSGSFSEQPGDAINCSSVGLADSNETTSEPFPNPSSDIVRLALRDAAAEVFKSEIINASGQSVDTQIIKEGNQIRIDVSHLPVGVYQLSVITSGNLRIKKRIVRM